MKMEISISALITIALFIEALVQVIKPLYNEEAKKFSIPEIISVAAGILVAVIGKINLLEGLITTDNIVAIYILYGLSGIALGRGPSFVHDLWSKIKIFNIDQAANAATSAANLSTIITNIINSYTKVPESTEEAKTAKVEAEVSEAEEAEAKKETEQTDEDEDEMEVQ